MSTILGVSLLLCFVSDSIVSVLLVDGTITRCFLGLSSTAGGGAITSSLSLDVEKDFGGSG